MAQKQRTATGTSTAFFRLSNRHISASLYRFSADSQQQSQNPYGFSSLGDLALYAMIGSILSNPSFTYAYGGLQHLLLRHTRNRYFSLHNAVRRLNKTGYLCRTRIPDGKNCFRDYYTLSHTSSAAVSDADASRCLSHAEGAKFRASYQPFQPPTEDYTEVSIPMLMDPNLSLGAKGLYIVIARYLRLQGYRPEIILTKDMLRAVCKEGSNAFDRMFRELRSHGYLILTRQKHPVTGYPMYLYTLHSAPDTVSVSDCHAKKNVVPTPSAPPPSAEKDKTVCPNGVTSDTKTDVPAYAQVSASAPRRTCSPAEIREQIEYSCLADEYPSERLDCIVSILQTYLSPPKTGDARQIPIRGVSYSREEVASRFSDLDSEDIRYVLDTYRDVSKTQKIHSVRRYLTTCLFHAKEDLALALDAFVIRTQGVSMT